MVYWTGDEYTKNKKLFLGVVVVFVTVFIIPLLINEAYKHGTLYSTVWGASDILSFYGTLLASAVTAIGVFFSLKYANKQYAETKRHEAQPIFSYTVFSCKRIENFSLDSLEIQSNAIKRESSSTEKSDYYREQSNNSAYFFISERGISCSKRISDEQREQIQVAQHAPGNGSTIKDHSEYAYLPHEFQNIGKGCALNVSISIENDNGQIGELNNYNIKPDEKLYVGIALALKMSLTGQYKVTIAYRDIYNNVYAQAESISLCFIADAGTFMVQESRNYEQVLIDD